MGTGEAAARGRREWSADDDALLDAIVALRARWRECHGHVTLAAVGLDASLVTFMVSGLCPRHGQFVTEWTGRVDDRPPLEARCPAGGGTRCAELSPVFVLV